MAKLAIKKATTDVTVYLFIQDSSVTTGAGKTGLAYDTASLVASYVRPGAARAALSLATQTVDGAHSDGGFKEIDATNMPGVYRLDLSDAVCATGVNSVVVMLKGAANMAPVLLEIQLVSYDPNDAVRLGVTALPNAAADAAGGLPISDAGALDLDAQVVTKINSVLDDTGTAGVVIAAAQTVATVTDVTNAVKISAGTGTGQLDFTSGVVKANLAQILGTALTETSGLIAAGFKKFFNVATPTGTVNSLPDAVAGANGGLPTTNGTKVSQTVDLTAGQTIEANGGTVATATNLTNLPAITADWLTAAGLKADAVTKIQAGLATTTGLSSVALSAAGIDAILDEVVVGTYTMRQLLKLFGAKLHGTATGGGTTSITYAGMDATAGVIVETVDTAGNRSAVTLTV